MERQAVESSLIAAVGFDPPSETLMVEFKPRREGEPPKVYTYRPFTAQRFAAFLAAPSLGKYFLAHIKPDTSLTYKRVETPDEKENEKASA